jgi:hypothetical protein
VPKHSRDGEGPDTSGATPAAPRRAMALQLRRFSFASAGSHPLGERLPPKQRAQYFVSVVVAPLAIPFLVLTVTRYDSGLTLFDYVSLLDLCFGFVAVAIAGCVHAFAVRQEEWYVWALASIIVIAILCGIAVHIDTASEVALLINNLHTVGASESERLLLLELISRKSANPLEWIVVLALGLGMCAKYSHLILAGESDA